MDLAREKALSDSTDVCSHNKMMEVGDPWNSEKEKKGEKCPVTSLIQKLPSVWPWTSHGDPGCDCFLLWNTRAVSCLKSDVWILQHRPVLKFCDALLFMWDEKKRAEEKQNSERRWCSSACHLWN